MKPRVSYRFLSVSEGDGFLRVSFRNERYVAVISGGEVGTSPDHESSAMALIRGAATIMAADSGVDYLLAKGIVPSVLVGDFDSCDPDSVLFCERSGSKVVTLNRDKDQTDTEAVLDEVLEQGFDQAVIIGALGGGRFEHSLANVFLLEPFLGRGMDVVLLSGNTTVCSVGHPDRVGDYPPTIEERAFYGEAGDWVSLLPISREVTGVTTTSLRFPLTDATLRRGSTLGVSNEMLTEEARVRVDSGFLVVILTHR